MAMDLDAGKGGRRAGTGPGKAGLAALFLLASQCAWGFGQNKVQYHTMRWRYLRTEHFSIYFGADAELPARFAASQIEGLYDSLSKALDYKLRHRIPIILYATHAEFTQTNVVPELLPEGVQGFTESFQNRVVLPFDGSYPAFRRVLHHELLHATIGDMSSTWKDRLRVGENNLPLWYQEGLAEYLSLGWDPASDYFMLDAVASGYAPNPEEDVGGFLAYKAGQLFYFYIDQTFGPGTIAKLVKAANRKGDMDKAFREVTGLSLSEVGEVWLRELRAIYWPEMERREYGKHAGRQLTDHTRDLSGFNMQPAFSPDGSKLAFLSDRGTDVGIYILDIASEKVKRAVVYAGEVQGHLSFHPFQSGLSWSPDGRRIAFVSDIGAHDVIHVVDVARGRVRERIDPGMQVIYTPSWSRDGDHIAFSGIKDGYSDIYVWDRRTRKALRLTHDLAQDNNPAFSPSGEWIAFESERTRPSPAGDSARPLAGLAEVSTAHAIYRIRATGGEPELVAGVPDGATWDQTMPAYGPSDSSLAYVSDRCGIPNLYLARLGDGGWASRPLTNMESACLSPTWSRDGSKLAFTLFGNRGWDIYLIHDPLARNVPDTLPPTRLARALADTSLRFFPPLPVQNLSSYSRQRQAAAGLPPRQRDSLLAAAFREPPAAGAPGGASAPVPALALTQTPYDGKVRGGAMPARAPLLPSLAAHIPRPGRLDTAALMAPGPAAAAPGPYHPRFVLETADLGVGYNSFATGYTGSVQLTLGDLLGDHALALGLSGGGGNWRAFGASAAYQYRAQRLLYGVDGFYTSNYDPVDPTGYVRDEQYGGGLSLAYPLTIFTRVEADLAAFTSTRSLWRVPAEVVADSAARAERVSALRPSLTWSSDDADWGQTGPINGRRLEATVSVVPPAFGEDFAFALFDSDFRRYWRLWKKYTFAARLSAGASTALGDHRNPQSFLVGGDDLIPLVYAGVRQGRGPRDLAELTFYELGLPVRGFEYYEFQGDKKLIGNLEFRFPFIDELRADWPFHLDLRYLMGSVFADYGGAWYTGNPWDQFGLGMGFGLRMAFGPLVLRWTRGYSWPGVGPGNGDARDYWAVGAEF